MVSNSRVLPALLSTALLAAAMGCHRQASSDTAAIVNGKTILRTEVEKFYKNNLGDSHQQPAPEQADIQRLNILHQLIDETILQQRAEKLSLTASDEEVDAKLAEMKAPFTQEEFDQRLKNNGLALDDVKKQLRRNLTIEKLFNKEINAKINITDADITSYYNQNKAQYNLVEPAYHLSEIVVTSIPSQQPGNVQNSKASNEVEARKKIEMLHSRLEAGEDFGTLAGNFSEQPNNASNGGDMGFVSESQLHGEPIVYAAVAKLKPGEITDIVPVSDQSKKVVGFEIFRLIAKEPAGQRELNDPRVQQAIRQGLRDSRSQLLKSAYYEMLRDQSKIENYYAEDIFKKQGS